MNASATARGPVVVIGSGPAGAAAALFACRAGADTVIMEAGPRRADLGFTARLRGFTFAKRRPALRQRGDVTQVGDPTAELFEELAPGGLSNHWACAVPRFAEEDFQDAARAGEQHTWPIGYADLAPWYDQVEPLLRIAAGRLDGTRLPLGRVEVARDLGEEWDDVTRAAEGEGRAVVVMPYANGASTMVTRSATAFNAFSQLVLPAERRQELRVHYGAKALRVEWSPNERRAVAVIYRDVASGREERLPCSAVVLAAGAVNSAQILLQSTCDEFPRGLGNQHDVLGRYLHDHPLGKLVVDVARPVKIFPASYITRPELARSRPLYAAAYMQWSGAPQFVRTVLRGHPGRCTQIGFSVFGTMEPRPENFVALEPSDGLLAGGPARFDPPNGSRRRLVMRLRHEPEALDTLEQARADLLRILERAGWQPRESVWKVEPPGNSVHYGGTCRMHASPRFGVVDGYCRVHGVPNVAVADSAVFTTGPEKNPVLTAMALAARAADRLARELL